MSYYVDITVHISRDGKHVLSYHEDDTYCLLVYNDEKDLHWFEALTPHTLISYHLLKYKPEGEDDLVKVEDVKGKTTKSKLLREIMRYKYKPVPNMITIHKSIDNMFDAIEGKT